MPGSRKVTVRLKRKTTDENNDSTQPKVVKKNASSPLRGGNVLTFGQGDVGQLGLGDGTMEMKQPSSIKEVDDINFVQVTCGGMHTIAVTDRGEVYSWGCNDDGALGRFTNGDDGDEYFARKVLLPEGVYIQSVSAGDSHTAALTNDGRVFAWGAYRDASGQIGLTAATLGKKNEIIRIYPKTETIDDPAVKIVSGNDHTVILTERGLLFTCGSGEQGQLGRIKECFGHRGGRRGLNFILAPQQVRFRKKLFFSDVFTGSFCTFALCRDSADVYAWGLNNYGQLGSGNNENYFNPEIIKSLTTIRQKSNGLHIQGGQHHSILVDGNGVAYAIGRAEYGRLGFGKDPMETPFPKRIVALENEKVSQIACGEAVSFAITEKGHLYSWGLGTNLQLGVGEEDDIFEPMQIKSKNTYNVEVMQVSSGGQHTAILITKKK